MDQKKLHILSLLAALTAATIFGMSFMFSKMALATAAPTVLLAFRFTVAVAAMSLVIALNALVGKVRGKPLFAFSLKGKPVGKLLLLGIVQPVAYFIFENYGILYTSAAVAGTIIAAVPVCCILMDVLVLHERVTRRQVLCALGAIGGVALISVGGAVMISALGLLFLLLTMLSDTLYYGLSHDAAKRFTPFEMTYVMFVVGMAVFIPVALIQAGGISSELITAPAQSGSFWLAELAPDEWTLDPAAYGFENMLVVDDGHYESDEGSFDYMLVLRPWGTDWSDVEAAAPALLPYFYNDWYLPQIESGASMPDAFDPAQVHSAAAETDNEE